MFRADELAADVLVVAVGSHEPHVREFGDDVLVDATVIIETREAGEIVHALGSGAIELNDLGELATIVRDRWQPAMGRRVFKSVGMGWQDLFVASALFERWGQTPRAAN